MGFDAPPPPPGLAPPRSMGAAAMAGAAIDPRCGSGWTGSRSRSAGQRRSFLLAYATAAALLVGLVCWAGTILSEIYR